MAGLPWPSLSLAAASEASYAEDAGVLKASVVFHTCRAELNYVPALSEPVFPVVGLFRESVAVTLWYKTLSTVAFQMLPHIQGKRKMKV